MHDAKILAPTDLINKWLALLIYSVFDSRKSIRENFEYASRIS
jgi:hypothetical protein